MIPLTSPSSSPQFPSNILLPLASGRYFVHTDISNDQHVKHVINVTWNVRSLYNAGSLTAAAGELARYKLDLVGVHAVRWDKGTQ